VAANLAAKFFLISAHPASPGVNSRCNSNVLRGKSRIPLPIGAENFHCRGREFHSWGQAISNHDGIHGNRSDDRASFAFMFMALNRTRAQWSSAPRHDAETLPYHHHRLRQPQPGP
jgi:hypothetical protein